MFSSVTLAMRGRDELKINGIFCRLIRTPMSLSNKSCGYSLLIKGDFTKALEILGSKGISYIGTSAVDEV